MHTDLFINNEYRPASSGKRFDVINPASEEVVGAVAEGDGADIDHAVGAARACFTSDAWQKLSARKRGAILARAADILASRQPDIAAVRVEH
jgi:acyl-CoA reductase-like NAD-dependent aldehyde dehydrogenase